MGDSADFASYVVARWPAVVRTLVLLGQPPEEADEIAVEALSRCAPGFDRERREGDVDVWVYRTVLDTRARRREPARQVAEEVARAPVAVAASLPDLEERTARLHELETALAALPPGEREAAVLGLVAELDDVQVSEVLGGSPEVGAITGSVAFREATEAIPIRPAPDREVVGRARARRRRTVRWTSGVTAAVVAVVGLGTWLGTREPTVALPDAVVTEVDNPAGVPWYANHLLHLERVTVELPQIESMVQVPDGVVYVGRAGGVVLVDSAGRQTLLGTTDPRLPVVGNRLRGVVAWLDVEGSPELVVHDTLGSREVARRPVDQGVRPVALDQDRFYYMQDGRPWSWTYPFEPGIEPGDELLDVASAVRASEFSGASVLVSQPLFDIEVTVPGVGAQLSPDGDFVLTRVDFGLPDEVRIYLAATGESLPTGIDDGEIALAATFGDDHTVTYLVAQRAHTPEGGDFVRLSESGPHLLRTCDLDAEALTCATVSQLANNSGEPVLPD